MIVPSVVIETVFIGDVLKVVYHIDFKCGGINFRKMKATERDFFKIQILKSGSLLPNCTMKLPHSITIFCYLSHGIR